MEFIEKQYFTLAQAEKLIPEVEQVLKRLLAIQETLSAFDEVKLNFEDEFKGVVHHIVKNKNFHKLNFDLYRGIEQMLDMGVILKALNLGLIDFYSKHENREIFLCWKLGESRIEHWHEINTGFSGRRPIAEIKKF